MIKGCKSIAEYAIRKWLERENFVLSCFELDFDLEHNTAYVRDKAGEELKLVYERETGSVHVQE